MTRSLFASIILVTSACTTKPGGKGGRDTDDTDTDTEELPLTEGLPQFRGDRPKNVLVISLDTFRRDYLKRYGGVAGSDVLPWLDGLLEDGAALDRHTSCSSWTFPGVSCALNGMSNLDLGYLPKLTGAGQDSDSPPRDTLAWWLQGQGYATVLLTSNSWLTKYNVEYGYEYAEHPDTDRAINIYNLGKTALFDTREDGQPWYLHIHLKEPHVAYNPPEEYLAGLEDLPPLEWDLTDHDTHYQLTDDWADLTDDERELITAHMLVRYQGEMQFLDDQLRDIWADLEMYGLLDDTLVVFWSDHGEQFWEHGAQSHGYSLHREENDAVGLLWAKNIVPIAWTEPTTHIDIAPMVTAALGLEPSPTWTGRALGDAALDRPILHEIVGREGPVLSVVQEDLSLHYWWNGQKELFDLATDPTEAANLYDPKDPRVIALWDQLLPDVERMEPHIPEWGKPVNPGP